MSVKAITNLRVCVTCDACDCQYHYDLPVSGQAPLRERSATTDLAEHIEQRVRDTNLPYPEAPYYKACPECGYIPKWMARCAARRTALHFAATLFVVPILMTMAVSVVEQYLGMLGVIIAGTCMTTALIGAPLALVLTPGVAARQIEDTRTRWFVQHPQPHQTRVPKVSVVAS
jgi:hypothetical protein